MTGRAAGDVPGRPELDAAVPSSAGGDRLLELIKVQALLRAPGGCPWDQEQTHRSLARHLLEETHELLEAIDADDGDRIRDELGDVLLQVTFHAQISKDDGGWDIDDVADGLVRKLIHRHPHVFGDTEVSGSDEVLVNWEKLKAEETGGRVGVEQDIPVTLPALARAGKVQRRAAGWGFAFRSRQEALAKLREEVAELAEASDPDHRESELGDVLFAAVAVGRADGADAETALRRTIRSFSERYERTTALARERGVDLESLGDADLRELWDEAKT
ncbi:MAG: nucleoside triphosphate diphosphatase [Actinomycetota bacterium]|nr:nucleoside triphosphate diphosphatase [Actinomycetota bacterium]